MQESNKKRFKASHNKPHKLCTKPKRSLQGQPRR